MPPIVVRLYNQILCGKGAPACPVPRLSQCMLIVFIGLFSLKAACPARTTQLHMLRLVKQFFSLKLNLLLHLGVLMAFPVGHVVVVGS
jgi:hypothetical protein